ncbi:MAG: hypothetical protein PHI28_05415 [Mangrovibacterium sp.]|nr:hypothetical protein [Mangrovibacterium sp.]
MKIANKREQSQTCLSFAEREQFAGVSRKITIKRAQKPNWFEVLPNVSNLRDEGAKITKEQSQVCLGLPSVRKSGGQVRVEDKLAWTMPNGSHLHKVNLREAKTILTAISLLGAGMLATLTCPAQTDIAFTYDDSGNRETRYVITLGRIDHNGNMDAPVTNLLEEPAEDRIGTQPVRISYNREEEALQVDFPCLTGQEATIEFATAEGKPVMKKTGKRSENKIGLSGYPSGSYRMTISVGEEKKVWEIVRT